MRQTACIARIDHAVARVTPDQVYNDLISIDHRVVEKAYAPLKRETATTGLMIRAFISTPVKERVFSMTMLRV